MSFFFFNDTATTEIYTLSLHDALPIWCPPRASSRRSRKCAPDARDHSIADQIPLELQRSQPVRERGDRKSTRLNSSHGYISYAVFCLKKKKKQNRTG